MKNNLNKLSVDGTWFEIQTTGEHSGGIMKLSFSAGSAGFARRNRKQTNYIDVIAPIASSPEQINAWFILESEAAKVLRLIQPAADQTEPNEFWKMIWRNIENLKTLDLKNLKI